MSVHWHDDEFGWCPCDEPVWLPDLNAQLRESLEPSAPAPAVSGQPEADR